MLFVEAKWLYNHALIFMKDHDISEYDTKIATVHGLDKDRNPITYDLQYISSQMKQSVIQSIKSSLKSSILAEKIRGLRYKSEYASINLKQYQKRIVSVHAG
ncbi:MAG: hypothetical protein IJG51_05655 [Synergistaceae bacterium]|nr:hypothetical protein [Synergistaceae bacterium]MBQ3398352.1 hypothetical protein [Synergistaceae bacterium]MBQ3759862.1 hypothetical protein [Synergistaceae bacterium]MBQ6418651.1 hypothetical protein [Synergistaceae bacterium]